MRVLRCEASCRTHVGLRNLDRMLALMCATSNNCATIDLTCVVLVLRLNRRFIGTPLRLPALLQRQHMCELQHCVCGSVHPIFHSGKTRSLARRDSFP